MHLHCYLYVYEILIRKPAFIVIIVVLVVIIIVSCSAIFYLLKEDRRTGSQEARRRRRYNAQPLVDRDLSNPKQHSKKWYSYLWSSRDDRHYHTQLDKSATMMERTREQGWIQANDREWDVEDFSEDRALRTTTDGNNQSTSLLREQESSASSFVGPTRVYTPTNRMNSNTSDGSSSVQRYDPHDIRGLPYPDQFPISPQATIPSIQQSQSYSPTLSSPSSPVLHRHIMKSPEPISNNNTPTPLHDSDHHHDDDDDSVPEDSQSQFAPPPVLRTTTAGSGTKFFESF